MRLFYAGGEVPSHRKILTEAGVQNVALSYMGLRRKVKFSRPWVIAEKFADSQEIFLDSGAFTVNRDEEKFSIGELREISDHYQSFIRENIDRLTMVSEFDALPMGRDWIEEQRESFYNGMPSEKFMPIWHEEWGLDYLTDLCLQYERVGIHSTSLNGRDLVPYLNRLVHSEGVALHGMAMTKPDEMESIRWDTISSTSWVSPQQFGDTIVWTGKELKRYPKKYKDQARKQHRTLFINAGFDAEAIEADDSSEVLRLSVWSWEKLMEDIERKHGRHLTVVTDRPNTPSDGFAEVGGEVVGIDTPEVGNSVATPKIREPVPLPVLGVTTHTEKVVDETGVERETEVQTFTVRSESTRKCVSCFLASKCPAFDPGANCAYNIPIQIKTRDQFVALQNSLIEMQAQRVMFMRFAEETEGGYADPNLSSEMDRLQKMLKAKAEIEQEGFSFKMEARAVGAGGRETMIQRLFGDKASQTARALPAPVRADEVIGELVPTEWTDGHE